MKMTYLMMRLEWKVFISSKPCRLIVVPRQEFIKHMFGKLLFFFVFPKLGISYKVKEKRDKALNGLIPLQQSYLIASPLTNNCILS